MLNILKSKKSLKYFPIVNKSISVINKRNFHYYIPSDNNEGGLNSIIATSYDPSNVEKDWYGWWENKGLFKPEDETDKPCYTILLPPPNVTGSLHIGHALTASIEDSLCRYKKMNGMNVLWIPGCDHAGISTQSVVEKKIAREEGKTRHDLGREEFLKRVWSWKEEYGNRIEHQSKAMGSMTDWSRKVFTMDEQFSKAVIETFLRLARDGLIYRDKKLVNWCPQLNTALSDIEVDYISLKKKTRVHVPSCGDKTFDFGVMHTFKYPVVNNYSEKEIIGYIPVSTTRLETMLGDTAVAIHPEDPRYTQFHGKYILHPFEPNRKIPIICDEKLVNMEVGSGAVKITPAHSFEDFECGKRHNLEFINILNKDGTLNDQVPLEFQGKNRFVVRQVLVEKLKEMELFLSEEDHEMELPKCSRSNDILEPMLMSQWFVKCEPLAKRALELVNQNEISIHPPSYKQTWNNWLENIHDWCISRQLWWGHRIPAFKIVDIGTINLDLLKNDNSIIIEQGLEKNVWVMSSNEDDAYEILEKYFPDARLNIQLSQDEDVLDTWFSSGLYPLAAFGWPSKSPEVLETLKKRYPSSVMETGSDILFFWVARMVMLCSYLSDNKEKPFNEIYLHAMVRDRQGKKMSKSLGNVIDPIDVINGSPLDVLLSTIEKNTNISKNEMNRAIQGTKQEFPKGIPQCGTDALRFTLIQYTQQGRQINLDISRAESNRHLCNKIWQATRFCLSHFERFNYCCQGDDSVLKRELLNSFDKCFNANVEATQIIQNQWIILKLNETVNVVRNSMDTYMFSDACNAIYQFFLYQFCDNYLEIVKPLLYSTNEISGNIILENTLHTMHYCLVTLLKLLHPYMPFITEELFHLCPLNGNENALYHNKINTNNKSTFIPKRSIIEYSYPNSLDVSNIVNENSDTLKKQMFIEDKVDKILELVQQFRSMRQNLQLPKSQDLIGYIHTHPQTDIFTLDSNELKIIETLTKFKNIIFINEDDSKELKKKHPLILSATAITNPQYSIMIQLVLPEEFQLEKELEKWNKKITQLENAKQKYLKQLHPNLPADIAEQLQQKLTQNEIEVVKVKDTCKQLEELMK
ncbi:hypothetical protein ABK040_013288 [Willaertia magna]